MRQVRNGFVLVILGALAVRVAWWALEPLIPYLIGGLIAVWAFGALYYRKGRW